MTTPSRNFFKKAHPACLLGLTLLCFGGSAASSRAGFELTIRQDPYNLNQVQFYSGVTDLKKDTAMTVVMTGSNSVGPAAYPVLVTAGILQIGAAAGSTDILSGSSINVGRSTDGGTLPAALCGFGTVRGNVEIGSLGTLSAGSATQTGTLTINGNLTLDTGSTAIFRVNSAADHDAIHVTGTATVQSGTNLNLLLTGNFADGTHISLLTADGGLSGGSNLTVTNALHNALTFTTATEFGVKGPDIVVIPQQTSFVPFAQNGNEGAVAHVLDSVVNDPRMHNLIQGLNQVTGSQLATALTELTPLQQTTVSQTTLTTGRANFGTLQNRLGNVRAGSTGLSLNQFNLMDQNLPAASLIAGTELPTGIKAFQPAPDNRWGFFAAADGNFGDIDGQTSQSNYHGAGFTVGSDYRLDNAFTVGFAAGYDYSKSDFDAGSNSTANSARFGPYASWQDHTGDWVDGMVGGAYHWYDSDRTAFGGTATSNTTGVEFDANLKYGHDFHVKQWTLTPTFGFEYLHLDINKYTETGSLAPLTVQDQSADSFRSNLGGIVAYGFKWKGIGWNPYVQAGWSHEFLNTAQAVNARFASGAGDVFSTAGDSLGHESATFGAGLQADLNDTVTTSLSYSGEANGFYQDHTFNASVRVRF